MLDEIDKLGADFRGDPSAALLEVLDRNKTCVFRSLSGRSIRPYQCDVYYYCKYPGSVPPALKRQDGVLELPGYTAEEKVFIENSLPYQNNSKNTDSRKEQITIEDDAIRANHQ